MKSSITLFALLAVIWTVVVVVGVLVLLPGQVPPCPELAPVGLPEVDRVAIAQMCADRADLGPGPLGAAPIWSIGVVLLLAIYGFLRRGRKGH